MKEKSDLDVVGALRGTQYENIAEKLKAEFDIVGIVSKAQLHNAPLKVRITHGADIYEVVRILDDRVVEDVAEAEKNVVIAIPPAPRKGRK